MTANKLVNVKLIEWRIFERFLPNVDGVEFGMSGVSGLVIQKWRAAEVASTSAR